MLNPVNYLEFVFMPIPTFAIPFVTPVLAMVFSTQSGIFVTPPRLSLMWLAIASMVLLVTAFERIMAISPVGNSGKPSLPVNMRIPGWMEDSGNTETARPLNTAEAITMVDQLE